MLIPQKFGKIHVVMIPENLLEKARMVDEAKIERRMDSKKPSKRGRKP